MKNSVMRGIMAAMLWGACFFMASAIEEVEKGGMLTGKVVDSKSQAPIEYATVAVYNATDNSVVSGAVTSPSGDFKITGLPMGRLRVEVSFLGYTSQKFDDIVLSDAQKSYNIGKIALVASAENLQEVEVRGDRKSFEYRIDKKVVNVSSQSTTASMTAIEVLENVPSVKVDIEGNVSLRGSTGFTVLIDGKPSILEGSDALRQIPASSIDNIEIITNPSAKYQPDGTAGIINVITKKNKSNGINGQVTANAGRFGTYGGDLLLNLRTKKINYNIGADYNNRVFEGDARALRETYQKMPADTTRLSSSGGYERKFVMWGVRGGLEFELDTSNTIAITGRFGGRSMGFISNNAFDESSKVSGYLNSYSSYDEFDRSGLFYSINGTWTHSFPSKGHTLTTLFDIGSRNAHETSENMLSETTGAPIQGKKSYEEGPGDRGEVRIDYVLPFSKVSKLEAGFQGRFGTEGDVTSMDTLNVTSGNYETDHLYDKTTDGTQNIYALYSTYSGVWKQFGYQAGLRGEYTYRLIKYSGDDFKIDRMDYFPTLHLSYNLPAENQVMASYARRVERTRGWYLEPFITWQDAYNVRTGNADILPEFIDSYELGYLKQFETAYFSLEGYYRITHNKVEMLSSVWQSTENPNGTILLNKPYNVGSDYSLGVEVAFNFKVDKWYEASLMGNMSSYEVTGKVEDKDFSNESFNWSGRLNNTFIPYKNTQLQLNGSFNSATATAQGQNEGYYSVDAAIRLEWMKRKLSTVVQARDLFGTAVQERWARGETFYNYNYTGNKAPMISFTAIYRFNNYNPKRQGNRGQGGGDEGGGGDEF